MRAVFFFLLALAPRCHASRVLRIGETLFDGLPSGIYLGGAPLNVAVHLAEQGVEASYVSAVGKDRLGREAVRRLNARGVDTSLLRTLDDHETGFVEVDIDEQGDASYTFATPAAWDHVSSKGITAEAAAADAVVWGSLGSRAATSREAVLMAANAAKYAVCDINLRPPFVDETVLVSVASGVDLLKLNDEELTPLANALHSVAKAYGTPGDLVVKLTAAACDATTAADAAAATASGDDDGTVATAIAEAAAAIGRAARASTVVVTRGAQGAVLWDSATQESWSHPGFVPPQVVDSVGAGDAFLAALLASLLADGGTPAEALAAGCRCGAFVASRAGATPAHEPDALAALQPASGTGESVRIER